MLLGSCGFQRKLAQMLRAACRFTPPRMQVLPAGVQVNAGIWR